MSFISLAQYTWTWKFLPCILHILNVLSIFSYEQILSFTNGLQMVLTNFTLGIAFCK